MKRGCDEMQDIFGEELKKILQNSKIQVPKAYDKRIEETFVISILMNQIAKNIVTNLIVK